jgi:hypothetical protein
MEKVSTSSLNPISPMLPSVIGGPAGCLVSFNHLIGAGEQGSDGEHAANATSMRRSAGDVSEVRNHSIDISVGKVGGIETSHLHSRPVAHRCGIAH